MGAPKPIRLSQHAQQQVERRGTTEAEIVEAIRSSDWQPAELGRLECRKDFRFGRLWKGRHYETKKVRPIFAEERDELIVVTVYVYYL